MRLLPVAPNPPTIERQAMQNSGRVDGLQVRSAIWYLDLMFAGCGVTCRRLYEQKLESR